MPVASLSLSSSFSRVCLSRKLSVIVWYDNYHSTRASAGRRPKVCLCFFDSSKNWGLEESRHPNKQTTSANHGGPQTRSSRSLLRNCGTFFRCKLLGLGFRAVYEDLKRKHGFGTKTQDLRAVATDVGISRIVDEGFVAKALGLLNPNF